MLDIGGVEMVALLVLWIIPAVVLYWIIRLAVRHGIADSRREDRTVESSRNVRATIARQRATYPSVED